MGTYHPDKHKNVGQETERSAPTAAGACKAKKKKKKYKKQTSRKTLILKNVAAVAMFRPVSLDYIKRYYVDHNLSSLILPQVVLIDSTSISLAEKISQEEQTNCISVTFFFQSY